MFKTHLYSGVSPTLLTPPFNVAQRQQGRSGRSTHLEESSSDECAVSKDDEPLSGEALSGETREPRSAGPGSQSVSRPRLCGVRQS